MLIERLVFGCGRLAGGFEARASRALLERALAGGIRALDTAPSYGLGLAEQVVGEVVGNDPAIAVTVKVGSDRPRHPLLRSALRRARRWLPRPSALDHDFTPAPPQPAEPERFAVSELERSLTESRRRLRRESFEQLLLHDSGAAPPDPAVGAFLAHQQAAGVARGVGVANAALYDPGLRLACPPGWTLQAAIDPAMLCGPVALPGAVILHSLARTDRWQRGRDPAYARAAAAAVAALAGCGERAALGIALPYCLAAHHVPAARLIYATSVAERLIAVLAALQAIDRGPGIAAVADVFAGAYATGSR